MGTGILALPHDMKVLGSVFGMTFIVINLAVNFYAGSILCNAATQVERTAQESLEYSDSPPSMHLQSRSYQATENPSCDHRRVHHDEMAVEEVHKQDGEGGMNRDTQSHSTTADFIAMTHALFDSHHTHPSSATVLVTTVYYVNIFLVLGNYVLVMSHAVMAMLQDQICLPTAGIIASLLMFAVSQLRTMARLGRSASIISLAALAILVLQCILPLLMGQSTTSSTALTDNIPDGRTLLSSNYSILRKFAAASSIGFAVGSQKLLLNIRHEFKQRADTTKSLGIALTVFGTIYILVCISAGTGEFPSTLDIIYGCI
jgi:amino acid permease